LPDAPTGSEEQTVAFTTSDGVRLGGTWFVPAPAGSVPPKRAILIVCGAGIPAKYFSGLARYLAEHGAAVLTFDYRGIAASREGRLRELKAGMDDWALKDIAAALKELSVRYRGIPVGAVAHSVGTLLIGAAPGADRVDRAVFLGAHTGYWRDYRRRWRVPLFLMWHVAMPAITRRLGYFPGRALRLGEDLPGQVALDWAGRRQRSLVSSKGDEARFGAALARYRQFTARTLVLSATDDAFAPPAAAVTLLANYPRIVAVRESVSPRQAGCRKVGHFGFLRRSARDFFWPRIAEWLLAP
jgi:predicted alpha/beta hydrolase